MATKGSRPPRASRAPLPTKFEPQLALLVKSPPEDDAWLHELKYDGYRIGCRIDDGRVRLISRNGKDWTTRFASVVDAASALPVEKALLDGEVAVVLPDGRTSFQALQNSFGGAASTGDLVYFVFDLLHLDGEDFSLEPLEQRKERLAKLVGQAKATDTIRYSDHVIGQGARFLEHACRLGLEGIVSKRRDLPYRSGRGPAWVKTKCIKRQELVIGGFTDPEGSRTGIGALLVGANDAREGLVFAGKVGTGFTHKSAAALRKQLEALEQPGCPFASRPPAAVSRRAHWVKPSLVAEVAFTEWTEDGRLRHPSFQGLRADKPAQEVHRERAVDPPKVARGGQRPVVAGISVSHPDRVVYPDISATKLEVVRFYESIGEWILPHITGRPLTLLRCPAGVNEDCFFMKHSGKWSPAGVRRARIQEKNKVGEYLVADNLTALIALIQANVIELHTWNATADRIEQPDRIVLDLDPGPQVTWDAIVDAARLIRTMMQEIGLESFVKTTGGRGLHVVVPLAPEADWQVGFDFSRAVAEALTRLDPKHHTTNFTKAGRERKILIDFMRNNRLSTSVAAFSTRARPGGPVSTPLAWDELEKRAQGSDQFTIRNLLSRLKKLRGDPWAAYWKSRQNLPEDGIERLAGVKPLR